jgi:hypothetical protein
MVTATKQSVAKHFAAGGLTAFYFPHRFLYKQTITSCLGEICKHNIFAQYLHKAQDKLDSQLHGIDQSVIALETTTMSIPLFNLDYMLL